MDYLNAMPVQHLRELHVTGLGHSPDGRREDHYAMTAADWQVTEWALERIRRGEWAHPWLLAFEYGGIGPQFEFRSDPDVMAAQVPPLYTLAHSVGEPV